MCVYIYIYMHYGMCSLYTYFRGQGTSRLRPVESSRSKLSIIKHPKGQKAEIPHYISPKYPWSKNCSGEVCPSGGRLHAASHCAQYRGGVGGIYRLGSGATAGSPA